MSWEGLSRTWMAVTSCRTAARPSPAWPCVQGSSGDPRADKVSAVVPRTSLGLCQVPVLQQMWQTSFTPLPSPGILPRKHRGNSAGRCKSRIQAHTRIEAGSQWIPGLWASSTPSTGSHQHLLPRRRPEPGMRNEPHVHRSPCFCEEDLHLRGLNQARGERQVPDNKCGWGSRKAALTLNASNPDPDIREMLSKGLLKEWVCVQSLSCIWLCHPMDCSTPGFPLLHHLPEFAETHVHQVSDAIQPSHLVYCMEKKKNDPKSPSPWGNNARKHGKANMRERKEFLQI